MIELLPSEICEVVDHEAVKGAGRVNDASPQGDLQMFMKCY